MSAPAVPLNGKLEAHSLPAVLRALLLERRDGCLTVVRGTITRRLYLRGGMIVYGSSTDRQDRLGEILVAQGKLSKADHKKYWEESKSGNRLLGITLLVNDRITMSDLYLGVTAQIVTILDRLQKWRKGDYDFEEGRAPAAGTVLLRIPLALYLRTDLEKIPAAKKTAAKGAPEKKATAKKPAPKKAATRKATKAKGAATEPPFAAPDSAAVQPHPPGSAGAEEQEFEIHAETADAGPLSAAAVRELACVGEVSFMVQELRKRLDQDPFALLGVPADADRPAIQAAYHRIAKVLHPDRLPKGCAPDLVREADDVFREVTVAVQAAEERLGRAADAAPLPEPAPQRGRAPVADDQSRRFFAKGREWIAKRNYWQAADALRQAVRLKPAEATYRQYLGLSLMQTKRLHEAEEHLVEATRLEPNNPAHYVNLGRVYRGGRLYKKAREAFERALRIDPRDEHARDELRDLPDERPPAPKANGGLLKKLFGKG
jgi:tetratricopeptide (TPR) repeat protein